MAFEHFVQSGTKQLRCGYTTGTCAALAAEGATQLLLTGTAPKTLSVRTPKGWTVEVVPEVCEQKEDGTVRCAVRKDAGDDPDVTDGMPVVATVSLGEPSSEAVVIDGGDGVGRVTKPGLDQPVGNAAINRVPRQMIRDAVLDVCEELDYDSTSVKNWTTTPLRKAPYRSSSPSPAGRRGRRRPSTRSWASKAACRSSGLPASSSP